MTNKVKGLPIHYTRLRLRERLRLRIRLRLKEV
jgi:hypothetical protein